MLGVAISAIDLDRSVQEITRWIDEGEQHYVCVTGVHGVMESQADPELMQIHHDSGLTTPDGMPMVWAGRWAGLDVERVYGPDLMLPLCARAAERGWTSFFYGGAEGVPEQLAEQLAQRFPGLKIVGTYSPPFRPLTPEEDDEIVARINATGAGPRLGRAQHAEAGAVDGRPRRPHQRAGADRRRRRVRHPRRGRSDRRRAGCSARVSSGCSDWRWSRADSGAAT